MVRAAGEMLERARTEDVRLALLMDTSAACGSQVIYDGPRHLRVYRAGPGVAAALLIRSGASAIPGRYGAWRRQLASSAFRSLAVARATRSASPAGLS